MVAAGIPSTWLFLLMFLGGGSALPVSIPPLPPDQGLMRAAPEECLFYLSTAGVGTADAASKNQTEQLLAEPEVKKFSAELENFLFGMMRQGAKSPHDQVIADAAPVLIKTLLTRPAMLYVSKVIPEKKEVRAAVVINAGGEKEKLTESLSKLEGLALADAHATSNVVEKTIEGVKFRQFPTSHNEPEFRWGFKGDYLIMTLGSETEDVVKRLAADGKPPAWLTRLDEKMAIERPAVRSYINIAGILTTIRPLMTDPKAPLVLEALGLTNVKSIESSSGLDANGMVQHALISIDGEPAGLFALGAAKPLALSDLESVPADANIASVKRFDLLDTYKRIMAGIEKVDPAVAAQAKAHVAQVEAMLQIKLEDDLLGAVGDVWRVYNSSAEGGLLWNGLALEVNVRDRVKLEGAINKLAPFLGHAKVTLKEEVVGEHHIHYVVSAGASIPVTPAWCITSDRLIFALNPQMVKSVLSRSADFKSLAKLEAVAHEFQGADPPMAIMYSDAKSGLQGLYSAAQMFMPMITAELAKQGIKGDVPMLPAFSTVAKHALPQIVTLKRTKDGLLFTQKSSLPIVNLGVTQAGPLLIGLALPAVQSARSSARHSQSINNLKHLSLGMLTYHENHKHFPAAASVDKDKKPLLSWRVQMLPYLEEQALYNEFHQDEPWDSEHNKKLIERMPRTFDDPAASDATRKAGKTIYMVPTGAGGMFGGEEGLKMQQLRDGTSKTIMIVTVGEDRAVPWTKPEDVEIDAAKPLPSFAGPHPNIFLAAFADGHVMAFENNVDQTMLRALFTPNGGEVVAP